MRPVVLLAVISLISTNSSFALEWPNLISDQTSVEDSEVSLLDKLIPAVGHSVERPLLDVSIFNRPIESQDVAAFDLSGAVIRAQNSGGSGGGGGAGAAAATDPSQPLAQLQFQNLSVPSTYGQDGYGNTFIIQPVIPLHLGWEGIPYHVLRPTFPIIAPTPDPDGPLGVENGIGDTTLLDVYVHPMEDIKTNIGVGPAYIFPTSSNPQMGLGEWQIGPTVFVVSTIVPKWNLGALVEVPFSMESDAYSVLVQPIIVRTLPNEWYVGSGDLLWKFDDQNGEYAIPLSARVGKILKFGDQAVNVYVQPQYTPRGFHNESTVEWGIKFNVTLLYPQAKCDDPLLSH